MYILYNINFKVIKLERKKIKKMKRAYSRVKKLVHNTDEWSYTRTNGFYIVLLAINKHLHNYTLSDVDVFV
jgi:hypothetical protein